MKLQQLLQILPKTFGRQRDDSGNQSSSVINEMIVDNGDNTYTVRFYDLATLQPEYVTVPRPVVTDEKFGRLFGASADQETEPSNPSNSAFWVPLVERAYTQ